ncbi:MAG TPA: bifunctional UDP-N-acetylmuramoyl-tripeptide:D-alanyl-D-alanine ligase/alanine racemase [Bacteroidia bacterium]|nr:bifunctional UDP-N-acetylmuramoyl-tripeptide:D-alanyl-D-alanine ligase/alanine racemase [Bacteroidia bacterium]HNT79337.1 bifunctional UDP-N-acetylmuramoyl-tripeptide:D-alanyl-D-alanine ligase/alanine racemase [Bacteroidia bacterium]
MSNQAHIIYDIKRLSEAMNAQVINAAGTELNIRYLSTDSRKLSSPDDTLFFAIEGDRRDGHEFVEPLLQKGVRAFVISKKDFAKAESKAVYFVVNDTLLALQRLSRTHRELFDIPVIGITGSNGKTIVKEWLYQLMREDYHIVKSPKSYNSQIGVPLSVWQMRSENDLAIFEAGISKSGEMKALAEIVKAQIGLFTNIGQAHAENFESFEQKILEKLQLFAPCKALVYCRDYLLIEQQINASKILPQNIRLFTWSRKMRADLQIGRVKQFENYTEIQGVFKNNFATIQIPFTDDASIENAIHCWAMMLFLEIDQATISDRMKQLIPVAMRLEMKEGINHCSIINDSYNSDLGSLSIALDFMNQQKLFTDKTVILSDILQSGKDKEQLYTEVNVLLRQKNIDRLIGIGPDLLSVQHLFSGQTEFYESTEKFKQEFVASRFHNEMILLKGARAFGFETLLEMFQKKAHETVLEINLSALEHNLNYYRSFIKPGTQIMAMVKALGYGSGSHEIADLLQFHRVDYLAVAYADEGIELRKAGIHIPIMVMSPEEQSFDQMIQHNLEPEIYSFRVLQSFAEAVQKKADRTTPFPVHLKIDSGMHRLGFEMREINQLIVRLQNHKQLEVKSVFTHLASTDQSTHDSFTQHQIELFNKVCLELSKHLKQDFIKHVLNSSGITRFPDHQMNMVRLGIGMHGVGVPKNVLKHLIPVARLKTTVSQVRSVKAGESIGYNRKGVLKRDSMIATLGIGYADGFNRKLGNGNFSVLINKRPAPVIGSVCMDMIMVDVTDIPVKEGSEAIVFGPEHPIELMAAALDTIPYEILTSISGRVKRVYFQE